MLLQMDDSCCLTPPDKMVIQKQKKIRDQKLQVELSCLAEGVFFIEHSLLEVKKSFRFLMHF